MEVQIVEPGPAARPPSALGYADGSMGPSCRSYDQRPDPVTVEQEQRMPEPDRNAVEAVGEGVVRATTTPAS